MGGGGGGEIEPYQAEWGPHSHRVRQRLTQLGLDFVAHQVPVEPAERADLERATGRRSIPAVVLEDGSVFSGDDEILAALDGRFAEPAEAAVIARRRSRSGPSGFGWLTVPRRKAWRREEEGEGGAREGRGGGGGRVRGGGGGGGGGGRGGGGSGVWRPGRQRAISAGARETRTPGHDTSVPGLG